MKKIERPMGASSYELSYIAHIINNTNELNNVCAVNINKKLVYIGRLSDPDTFMPLVVLMFTGNEGKLLEFDTEYYVVSIEYLADSKFEYNISDFKIVKK